MRVHVRVHVHVHVHVRVRVRVHVHMQHLARRGSRERSENLLRARSQPTDGTESTECGLGKRQLARRREDARALDDDRDQLVDTCMCMCMCMCI